MAKNRNTFAKRSRETEKKRKAQSKIDRRNHRKDRPLGSDTSPQPMPDGMAVSPERAPERAPGEQPL